MSLVMKKFAAVGFLAFLGLWIVASIRGLTLDYPPPAPLSIELIREDYSRQQVANNLKAVGLAETPAPMLLDLADIEKIRIHEKRAVLATNSVEFDDDSTKIHSAIAAHKAEILTYRKSGIEPGRRLILEIGVHPDGFDALVEQLRGVGRLASINVEQKDRTGEFRKLHAERQRLKKNLDSLNKLRDGKTLSLDDALRLESKAQEIEQKIQDLGVQFGDLLGKQSYYHVHVTLAEHQAGDKRDLAYSIPQRLFHAALWAAVWWFAVALAVAIALATRRSVWMLRQKAS
jgi:Domain of unknown function (DUF4349)